MWHVIDNSDHWPQRNTHISKVNFLKYPALNYQNGLRHSEYLDMLNEAGFDTVREERVIDQSACQRSLFCRFQRVSGASRRRTWHCVHLCDGLPTVHRSHVGAGLAQ